MVATSSGRSGVTWSQVAIGAPPPRRSWSGQNRAGRVLIAGSGTPGWPPARFRRGARWQRHTGGTGGVDLAVDDLGGTAVLGREPVISQVQVDPGRLDRGVTGLCLHG